MDESAGDVRLIRASLASGTIVVMQTIVNDTGSPGVQPTRLVLLAATVLLGLSAGFFYTYEASVTLGLAEVGDSTYVETFQAINETIRNPGFGIVVFGVIPTLGLAVALNWRGANSLGRWLLAAGIVLCLAGAAVTVIGNVPLNEDLAELTALTPTTAHEARSAFEDSWNQLNLVRAVVFAASFIAVASVPFVSPLSTGRARSEPTIDQNR